MTIPELFFFLFHPYPGRVVARQEHANFSDKSPIKRVRCRRTATDERVRPGTNLAQAHAWAKRFPDGRAAVMHYFTGRTTCR